MRNEPDGENVILPGVEQSPTRDDDQLNQKPSYYQLFRAFVTPAKRKRRRWLPEGCEPIVFFSHANDVSKVQTQKGKLIWEE